MRKLLNRLNYANVMATIAVFMVLGGGAFAAVRLGKNAVKAKNIAAGAVKTKKIANNAVTQQKIKPLTFAAASGFANGWSSAVAIPGAQFGKDALGIVHLRGNVVNGTDNLPAFVLPSGFRPSTGRSYATTSGFSTECTIGVETNGEVTPTGCNNLFVSLDVISFE
jgi:hypothetical protein